MAMHQTWYTNNQFRKSNLRALVFWPIVGRIHIASPFFFCAHSRLAEIGHWGPSLTSSFSSFLLYGDGGGLINQASDRFGFSPWTHDDIQHPIDYKFRFPPWNFGAFDRPGGIRETLPPSISGHRESVLSFSRNGGCEYVWFWAPASA